MNPPFTHMTKRPAGEEFMLEAFLGFIHFAEKKKELLEDYAEYLKEEATVPTLNYHDWLVVYVWGEDE